MNGFYGNMLLFFPEQKTALTAYRMTAQVNGGYTREENSDINVTGVIQNTSGRRLKDSNGNLVNGGGQELWTDSAANLDGFFITWEGDVYRINASNKWQREGGFFRYTLEKVVGNNGTEHDDASWNFGNNSFC